MSVSVGKSCGAVEDGKRGVVALGLSLPVVMSQMRLVNFLFAHSPGNCDQKALAGFGMRQ